MTYKKLSILVASLTMLTAGVPAYAKDPCASLLCMAGKVSGGVQGNGSSADGCSQPITDFLSIIETDHGHMDLNATPTARRKYLNSCSGGSTNASSIDSIISMFGTATL